MTPAMVARAHLHASDTLRDSHTLIVLDNGEHLLDACAALADTLLKACPHLTVLATSREPLRVQGETVWRVPAEIASGGDPDELLLDWIADHLKQP